MGFGAAHKLFFSRLLFHTDCESFPVSSGDQDGWKSLHGKRLDLRSNPWAFYALPPGWDMASQGGQQGPRLTQRLRWGGEEGNVGTEEGRALPRMCMPLLLASALR